MALQQMIMQIDAAMKSKYLHWKIYSWSHEIFPQLNMIITLYKFITLR